MATEIVPVSPRLEAISKSALSFFWGTAPLLVHSGHPRDHHTPLPQFLSLGTLRPQTLGHMGSSRGPPPHTPAAVLFPQEQSEATGSQASALREPGNGREPRATSPGRPIPPAHSGLLRRGTPPLEVLPSPGGLLRMGTLLHLEVLLPALEFR